METISPSILYAIGASLCAGLYAFTAKIATEHLKDSHSFVFYALCGALVLGTFGFFYHIDTFVFSWAQI
ncbi:MAG: hypothetical protein H6767_05675 [Candidatus Peribacteria bacterium]|nr:MAG: hypothetical protein H6767_05675 [Candidatus Peribacteria bacterium]